MMSDVGQQLLPVLKIGQPQYVIDSVTDEVTAILERLNKKYSSSAVLSFADTTASTMVNEVGRSNAERFDKSIEATTGVNLGGVITSENLTDFVDLNINTNVSLIKSLPEEYFKQIEVIVNNGLTQGTRYSTIEKQIVALTGSANSGLRKRIKTIATDQVQTINAQINLRRSDALGIKKGIWRTAEDEKVRGNPSGLYPNAKPSHFKLNGKEFDLAKGMKVNGQYIWPGIPVNCRCSYSPVIVLE